MKKRTRRALLALLMIGLVLALGSVVAQADPGAQGGDPFFSTRLGPVPEKSPQAGSGAPEAELGLPVWGNSGWQRWSGVLDHIPWTPLLVVMFGLGFTFWKDPENSAKMWSWLVDRFVSKRTSAHMNPSKVDEAVAGGGYPTQFPGPLLTLGGSTRDEGQVSFNAASEDSNMGVTTSDVIGPADAVFALDTSGHLAQILRDNQGQWRDASREQPIDKKPLNDGSGQEIWLFEDGSFEVVDVTSGRRVDFEQVLRNEQTLANFILSFATKTVMWTYLTRQVRIAIEPIPYVGPYGNHVLSQTNSNWMGLGASMGQQLLQYELSQASQYAPPLLTPVPPPGTVRVVVYEERANGELWNLCFGWTPQKNLFLVRGWEKYR